MQLPIGEEGEGRIITSNCHVRCNQPTCVRLLYTRTIYTPLVQFSYALVPRYPQRNGINIVAVLYMWSDTSPSTLHINIPTQHSPLSSHGGTIFIAILLTNDTHFSLSFVLKSFNVCFHVPLTIGRFPLLFS